MRKSMVPFATVSKNGSTSQAGASNASNDSAIDKVALMRLFDCEAATHLNSSLLDSSDSIDLAHAMRSRAPAMAIRIAMIEPPKRDHPSSSNQSIGHASDLLRKGMPVIPRCRLLFWQIAFRQSCRHRT